jgi:hypothetical protein
LSTELETAGELCFIGLDMTEIISTKILEFFDDVITYADHLLIFLHLVYHPLILVVEANHHPRMTLQVEEPVLTCRSD